MSNPVHLVSDFNIDLLASSLKARVDSSRRITAAPFGQVFQTLGAPDPAVINRDTILVVWTRPELVAEGFRRALALERVDPRPRA
jgi:hypothetical protein